MDQAERKEWMGIFSELGFYAGRPGAQSKHAQRLVEALDANEPEKWNNWRKRNRRICPDLREVELSGRFLSLLDLRDCRLDNAVLNRTDLHLSDLSGASLKGANLTSSNLSRARCEEADFTRAKLAHACLDGANLRRSNFRGAEMASSSLLGADLTGAKIIDAELPGAKLDRARLHHTVVRNSDLGYASFVNASLQSTRIENCRAAYVNAKRIEVGADVKQTDLFLGHTIRRVHGGLYQRRIQVQDLRVASFVGELEEPEALTHLINAGTDYVVLVLGPFDERGRKVLAEIKQNVWKVGRIPIVFEFEGPTDRALVDAVRVFGALSEFVIVELTNPRSVAFELNALAPDLAVPILPLIQEGKVPPAMFADLQRKYPWVLRPFAYRTTRQIRQQFPAMVDLVMATRGSLSQRFEGVNPNPLPIGRATRMARELEESEEHAAPRKRKKSR